MHEHQPKVFHTEGSYHVSGPTAESDEIYSVWLVQHDHTLHPHEVSVGKFSRQRTCWFHENNPDHPRWDNLPEGLRLNHEEALIYIAAAMQHIHAIGNAV